MHSLVCRCNRLLLVAIGCNIYFHSMNTFYLVLRVIPTPQNELINEVQGALASCWLCDDDQVSASILAAFKLRQLDWTVVGIEEAPVIVTEDDYRENETYLDRFRSAQIRGMSIEFTAWGKNGKTYRGPIEPKKANHFDLGDYLSQMLNLSGPEDVCISRLGTDAPSQSRH